MNATMTKLGVRTELGCSYPECAAFGYPLWKQLSEGGYDVCSVLEITSLEEWRNRNRTARKRADRASRRGYRFVRVQRFERAEEVYLINISTDVRQGRPMTPGYRHPVTYGRDEYPCSRHGVHAYGVEEPDGTLVAYTWIYRAGELALVSQILGHHRYLKDEIMYLLVAGTVEAESSEPGFIVYNRHDSGSDGLRFFKERLGFQAQAVEWLP